MSIQEANVWALEQRDKADPRKAAIERLRCAAAKRRERKPTNPLETLKPDPSYKVGEFNAEADAFNVESSDGKKLLGKSLSNGNVRSGQKVRSFSDTNGRVVIDVKPKGRDIVIPKPLTKAPVEEEFWPCTVAFLYSRIKPNTEDLTDNGATDITSYDYAEPVYAGAIRGEGYAQRFDELGDYETAAKALANDYKDSRKLKPGQGGSGGAADNAAWGSGSVDAVTIWFYIGSPTSALTNGKIFQVSGQPTHTSAGNVTDYGPGFAMEVYRGGSISSAIFPNEAIGAGPLTKKIKESFPNLGGKIGYAGRIEKWRGVQDYISNSSIYYFRNTPSASETPQTPVSFPPGYVQGSTNPWQTTNADWYQFGWPDPQYIGCASTSWINVNTSAITNADCGASIANNQWYWGGDATPTRARIDKDNPSGYIGTTGVFVCWQGHKDNAGMAQSFFEAFATYWGIQGSVTKLGTANPYGCGIPTPDGGTGYPPAPPGPPRFIVKSLGRKAEIWLKVCRQNDPPLEIKLPFEFAAVVEQQQIVGSGSFSSGGTNSSRSVLYTYGSHSFTTQLLENPHATLSIDKEFAYINISYGAEMIWEDPLSFPIKLKKEGNSVSRTVGEKPTIYNGIVGEYVFASFGTNWQTEPRYEKHCFSYCQAYKVRLPTANNRSLAIVGNQRYRRGEIITLTANSPDTEFDQKYLIADFKTERFENIPPPPGREIDEIARWTNPSPDHASFGGLPALMQFPFQSAYYEAQQRHIPIQYMPKFYKPQSNWSKMDWVHFQLQEKPRLFLPINEVLPFQVFVTPEYANHPIDVIFDLDGRFGRGGRAEKISHPSAFGSASSFSQGYTSQGYLQYQYPLFLSFKEQLVGNGLLTDGQLTKWYRISTSSFPIMNQVKRNPPPD
jgi:hypothetical protein